MDNLMGVINSINAVVWGPAMLLLIVGTGIFMTVKTDFFTIRRLKYVFDSTLFKVFKKDKGESQGEGEITPFQAMATALAATLGTGNIAGVASAIAMGGPGSIFWMWLSAFFGMATKFSEVVLSIEYRGHREDGSLVGGPMYYLQNGLNKPILAKMFAVFAAIAALGTGNMIQSNSVAESLEMTFGINKVLTGVVLAVIVGLALFGGLKRIAKITELLVPFMAIFYVGGGLAIVILNFSKVPAAFGEIFKLAFTTKAAVGGFAGSTIAMAMRSGIARGVFSNEAGLGSAPIAHAPAATDHPVRQGLWGIFEVFMSSIVVCTITALAIIITGVWTSGQDGAVLTISAFNAALPGNIGGYIVTFGLLFFALSTLLSWSYYGEVSLNFLFGEGTVKIYRIVWIPLVAIGAMTKLDLLWGVSDVFNGLMAIPNLIGVLGLSKVVVKLTREFFAKEDALAKEASLAEKASERA